MTSDKTVRRWRIEKEEEFEMKYGETEFPSADVAWKMIRSKEGGWQQYQDCKRGFHEYEWTPAICEYVCYFCLDVEAAFEEEEEFDSRDQCVVGPLYSGDGFKVDAVKDEVSDDDSENEVCGYVGGSDDDDADDTPSQSGNEKEEDLEEEVEEDSDENEQ